VPAQAAGVGSLVVASPPQANFGGLPHPTILAAAHLLGVAEVWAVGGAQAVALLSYGGTDTDGAELAPVDLITGPGNIYVTAAKRLCRGLVGIDAEAGPTEIAILADATADPAHVAADLISQAEHDVLAARVLVPDSEALADAVAAAPPGPAPPRPPSSPPPPPTRRTWPPTSSARPNTMCSPPACWSPTARRWPTPSTPRSPRRCRWSRMPSGCAPR